MPIGVFKVFQYFTLDSGEPLPVIDQDQWQPAVAKAASPGLPRHNLAYPLGGSHDNARVTAQVPPKQSPRENPQ
jgi:hypothetical protein